MARFNKKDPLHDPQKDMQRVVVYIDREKFKALRIKLLEQTGSSNVSDWARAQVDAFLKD